MGRMETTFVEQRKHKRYAPPDDAVAVCNTKIGRIINISEGGMAVNWIGDTSFSGDGMVTFLSSSKDVLINDLPVRFLSVRNEQASSMNAIKVQCIGVSFNYADTAQHDHVKEYIDGLAGNGHKDFKDNLELAPKLSDKFLVKIGHKLT